MNSAAALTTFFDTLSTRRARLVLLCVCRQPPPMAEAGQVREPKLSASWLVGNFCWALRAKLPTTGAYAPLDMLPLEVSLRVSCHSSIPLRPTIDTAAWLGL